MNQSNKSTISQFTPLRASSKCAEPKDSRRVRPSSRNLLEALLLVMSTACAGAPGEEQQDFATGPTMLPGDNCRSCHGGPSSQYPEAPNWSVAGTVFEGPESDVGAEGVRVLIRDINGTSEELVTNSVGNFYTSVVFENPYVVTLEKDGVSVTMPGPPPSGGCNACHNENPIGGAPGRLFLPADGTYESVAVCQENVLLVGPTRYPCAPFICVSETAGAGAHCLSACETDEDCSEGVCEADVCMAL